MPQFDILEKHFTAKHDRAMIESLQVQIKKNKKIKELGEGSTRIVFKINDRFILKVPSLWGIMGGAVRANLSEILLARRFRDHRLFCTTKPYIFGNQIVLLSEYTKQLFNRNNMPEGEHKKAMANPKIPKIIAKKLYDGCDQLGTDRKGNVICFDFGLERHMLELLPMGVPRDFTKTETDRLINRIPNLDTLLSRI